VSVVMSSLMLRNYSSPYKEYLKKACFTDRFKSIFMKLPYHRLASSDD
jgi:hypothetical protein